MADLIIPNKSFCKRCDCETDRTPSGGCKICNKAAVAKYRQNNAEKVRESEVKYRDNNKEKVCAAQKKYRDSNKEKSYESTMRWRGKNMDRFKSVSKEYKRNNRKKINETSKLWVISNPELKKAADLRYREKNREIAKQASSKWREENKEKLLITSRAYYAKNAESLKLESAIRKKANRPAHRVYEQNREAKKRINGGRLSVGLASKLYKLQKGKCACCGVTLGDDYHLDHIMPIALGGQNVDSNIQLLKSTCNQEKHAKHPVDFMQQRGFLL